MDPVAKTLGMGDEPDALGDPSVESTTGDPRGVEPSSASAIPNCCVSTIRIHVRFNPMMVCAECKNIIKCFTDERAFRNYLTFCNSRRRPVLTGRVDEYWTVAFRSYDTYNR